MINRFKNLKYRIEILGVIIALLMLFIWFGFFYFNDGINWDTRAKLGDSFGSLNALFSGLALAGIVFTILLQRKELSLQRDELKETRKEFQIQNKTLKIQRFENTFFNLLSLHHKIVDSIDYQEQITLKNNEFKKWKHAESMMILSEDKSNDNIVLQNIKGRDVFKDKFMVLNKEINDFVGEVKLPSKINYHNVTDGVKPFPKNHIKVVLSPIYLKNYNKVKTDFGHYFRNLYRIIKFVDESILVSEDEIEFDDNISEKDKKQVLKLNNFKLKYSYTSMLRAQLSDYELGWIFYNCLSSNGNEKFTPLVNQYALLKNLDWEGFHPNYIKTYAESAFNNPLKLEQ